MNYKMHHFYGWYSSLRQLILLLNIYFIHDLIQILNINLLTLYYLQMSLLLLFTILKLISAQVDVVWKANPYMNTGLLQLVVEGTTNNIQAVTQFLQPSYKYAVPFKSSFKNKPLICFGIINLELSGGTSGTKYFFRNQIDNNTLSQTAYDHILTLQNNNYIKNLKIGFLASDPIDNNFITIQYLTLDPSNPYQISAFTKYISSGSGYRQLVLDVSSQFVMQDDHVYGQLLYLQSFGIQIGADGLLQLGISIKITSSTKYDLIFWTNGNSKVYYLQPNFINFDQTNIQQSQISFIDFGTVQAKKVGKAGVVQIVQKIQDGFLIGPFLINMNPLLGLCDFTIDVNSPYQMSSKNGFQNLNYTYFNFRVRNCPVEYPFYYVQTQKCYSQCPSYCYLNQTYDFCYLCGYTCATCPNASFCQTCDDKMFRVLNKSTHQCNCAEGYYDSGVPMCSPCSEGCLKCTSPTDCLKCSNQNGYTLSAGICICGGTHYLDTQNNCIACSDSMFGCGKCSSSSQCLQCLPPTTNYNFNAGVCNCQQGFYQINNECMTCSKAIPGCLICGSSTSCQSCDQSNGFNLNDANTCSCLSGSFIDQKSLSCSLCSLVIMGCDTCSDQSTCTKCSDPFLLQNSKCVCSIQNYYIENNKCTICDSSCLTCNGNLPNNCLSCPEYMIYDSVWNSCNCTVPSQVSNGKACVSCSDLCSDTTCTNSTASNCLKCDCPCLNGFYFNSATSSCSVCNYDCLSCSNSACSCPQNMYDGSDGNSCKSCYYTCLTCQGPGTSSDNNCKTCNLTHKRQQKTTNCSCIEYYEDQGSADCVHSKCPDGQSFNTDGQCVVICGDGLVGLGQQCDDGNLQSSDGCSNLCVVEEGFSCTGDKITKSVCSFTTPLTITLVSLIKQQQSNNLTFTFHISPAIQDLKDANFSQIIDLGLPPDSIISYSYNPDGTLTAHVHYFSPLSNYTSNVTFDPSKFSQLFNLTPAILMQIPIQPQNNLSADLYSSEVYSKIDLMQNLVLVTNVLALTAFVIGLAIGKLVGIQMMGIVQLGYIGLILVSFSDPFYGPMSKLLYTTGYNVRVDNQQGHLPPNFDSLNYSQVPINNLNIMLSPEIVLLLVFLGLFTASKLIKSQTLSNRIRSYANLIIGEFMITFVLFSLYQYSIFLMIFTFFKPKMSSKLSLYGSIGSACVFGLFLIEVTLLYALFSQDYFGEFKSKLRAGKLCQNCYYYLHILQRLVIGVALGVGKGSYISGIACGSYLILMLVAMLVLRPYSSKEHNIRGVINYLCGIGIIGIYTFVSFKGHNSGNSFLVYLPFVIIGLMLVTVLTAIIFLTLQIYMRIKACKQNKIQNNEVNAALVIANQQNDFDKMAQQRLQKESRSSGTRSSLCFNNPRKLSTRKDSQESVLCNPNQQQINSPTRIKSKLLVTQQLNVSPPRKQSHFQQNQIAQMSEQDGDSMDEKTKKQDGGSVQNSARSHIPLNPQKLAEKTKQEQECVFPSSFQV